MSELRYDPVKRSWSVIAVERSRRPHDFQIDRGAGVAGGETNCPFDYGNEHHTPPEIYAIRTDGSSADTPGWQTRVIPNKYPALRVEGNLEREGRGMYDVVSGIGAHEIIIETPDHAVRLGTYTPAILRNLFATFRVRMIDLEKDLRFRYVLAFKNYGAKAGASLAHPHSQIIAVPVMPNMVKQALTSAYEHYSRKERCLFCDILTQERADDERIVAENDDFIAFAPFASAFPFELRVYPKRHGHDYRLITESELDSLALIMHELFGKLNAVLEDPPLNFLINTCPPLSARKGHPDYWNTIREDYHWHIEIVPRLTSIAGFEWGTGFAINPVLPEDAATFLREADVT